MKTFIRIIVVLINAALLCTHIATAQESEKCKSVHEKPIAIFIEPTAEEMDKMKRENSEEDYYTILDDVMYYDWHARKFLEERDIHYCITQSGNHSFITSSKKKYSINKSCPDWCLILWNGKTEPVVAETADIFMYDSYLKDAQ